MQRFQPSSFSDEATPNPRAVFAFRRDTMKKRTIFLLVLAAVLACVLFFCRFYFLGTSSDPVNAKTNADFQIPDFHSQTDKDEDGLDDQTDLLQGARTYCLVV